MSIPPNDRNMSFTYKYKFRNGTLVKTDLEGNELSVTEFHYTEQRPVQMQIPATSPPSQGLIGEYNVGSPNAFRSFERLINADDGGPILRRPNSATTTSPQYSSPSLQAPDHTGVSPLSSPSSTSSTSSSSSTLPQSEVIIPTSTSHDHTQNINNLSASMAASRFTPAELRQRDQNAILYSANLLTEGDTLVFIDYPNDIKTYDTTGFMVFDTPHRVHSQVLRSTGSPRFEKMFNPTYQHRIKRRKNLVHNLGNEIKYVLDLTPPDEGDDALELITSLSCSQGIRHWYTAEKRLRVSSGMVGGSDENLIAYTNFGAAEAGADSFKNNQKRSGKKEVNVYSSVGDMNSGKSDSEREAEDLARAVEESRREAEKLATSTEYRDVPEYDPVRHRAGIVRLLQILEGKAPQLDSAPKVWTLFALAKYFGCEQAVTDHILTWLIAEPNNYFIEILPEVSYRIGFGLNNAMITRATFAILVGQESLSLVSREKGKFDADKRKTTQFGRLIEDVDEDTKTRLEYASRSFTERLNKIFSELAVGPLEWLNKLVSFRDISPFTTQTTSMDKSPDATAYATLLSAARDLQYHLREYIRGRIMAVLYKKLDVVEQDNWNKHRHYETYIGTDYPFADVYNVQLSCEERVLTAFFWRMLKKVHLGEGSSAESNCAKEYICDDEHHNCLITSTKYEKITYSRVKNAAGFFNGAASLVRSKRKLSMLDSCNNIRGNGQVVSESSNAIEARVTATPKDDERHTTQWNQKPATELGFVDDDMDWNCHENFVPATSKTTSKSADEANSETNRRIKPIPIRSAKGKENANPPEPRFVQDSIPLRLKDGVAETVTSGKESFGSFELLLESQKDFEEAVEASRGEFKKAAAGEKGSAGNESSSSFATSAKSVNRSSPMDSTDTKFISYFDLKSFTRQATEYIHQICNDVLSTPEIGSDAMITDTLLCLGPQEFKYLPLWAGGDDDDSGGVFNEDIPTAFAGPNGPGPSFHTGFSSSSQQSGSEYDTCSMGKGSNSGVSTSVAVLDGFSDQLDRRTVVSDDEFGTSTISDSESEMAFSNMGSTIGHTERDDDDKSVATIEGMEAEEEEDDDMTMTFDENGSDDGTEMGFDVSEGKAMDSADSSLDPAIIVSSQDEPKSETKDGGHNSDEDWDIGDEDEDFDFGDSDEDRMDF